MTWRHRRAIAPLTATSALFADNNPGVSIRWDQRPLQAFESQPLTELARDYDLLVIDHPHLGEAVRHGALRALDDVDPGNEIATLAEQSVGRSHASYSFAGKQWALAIDAASPVSSYRPGRLEELPTTWREVGDLVRAGRVVLPLRSPHALMVFFWAARNLGFPVAANADAFMDRAQSLEALELLASSLHGLDPACLAMDPIAAYDLMSSGPDAPDYCPAGYGYVNYAEPDFRPHRLRFANVPQMASGGVTGTVLGGTGIAVSALSQHQDTAAKYAFWIAGADCQSTVYSASGGQPGNSVAWQSEVCNARVDGFFRDTRDTLEGAWVRPQYDGYLGFQDKASLAVSAFVAGEVTAARTAENLETLYQKSRHEYAATA